MPWKTPQEMYTIGLRYFAERKNDGRLYTISGLALALGMSYGKLSSSKQRVGFGPVVDLLLSHILDQAEEALYDSSTAAGAKFHALQLGFTEKSVVESRNTNVTVTYDALKELSNDDLETLTGIVGKITNTGADSSGAGSPVEEQDLVALPGPGAVAS